MSDFADRWLFKTSFEDLVFVSTIKHCTRWLSLWLRLFTYATLGLARETTASREHFFFILLIDRWLFKTSFEDLVFMISNEYCTRWLSLIACIHTHNATTRYRVEVLSFSLSISLCVCVLESTERLILKHKHRVFCDAKEVCIDRLTDRRRRRRRKKEEGG